MPHKDKLEARNYKKKYMRGYRALDKEKHAAYEKERQRRLRLEALIAYGGRCVCCGELRMEFLSLDHVNNDGAKHRKEVKCKSIGHWAKKHGYPNTLQILCHNCNMAKGMYGYCPHEKRVVT